MVFTNANDQGFKKDQGTKNCGNRQFFLIPTIYTKSFFILVTTCVDVDECKVTPCLCGDGKVCVNIVGQDNDAGTGYRSVKGSNGNQHNFHPSLSFLDVSMNPPTWSQWPWEDRMARELSRSSQEKKDTAPITQFPISIFTRPNQKLPM